MKLILFSSCFLLLFAVAFSALAHIRKPAGKPGHCWTEETGPLNKNEKKQLAGKCQLVTCGQDTVATLETCGVIADQNGNRIKPNLSKPYPTCCLG